MKICFLVFFINLYLQKCLIIQETGKTRIRKTQTPAEETPRIYTPTESSAPPICQDYIGKEVCCSEGSIKIMQNHFIQLQMVATCQTCLNNLYRFFCHLNCHPSQEDYIKKVYDKQYTVNNKKITATAIDYKLNRPTSCAMFKSCRKNGMFQTLEATKNFVGFFKFFGEGSISQVPDDLNDESYKYAGFFDFDDNEGLLLPYLNCNERYTSDVDAFGYPVDPSRECGCGECEESCGDIEWNGIVRERSIFYGLHVNVLFLFGFLIVVTVFANVWNYCKRKNEDGSEYSRPSLDSYEYIKKDIIDK